MVLGECKCPCPYAVEVHVDPLPWPNLWAVRECFEGRQAAVSREEGLTDTQTLGSPHLGSDGGCLVGVASTSEKSSPELVGSEERR